MANIRIEYKGKILVEGRVYNVRTQDRFSSEPGFAQIDFGDGSSPKGLSLNDIRELKALLNVIDLEKVK